MDGINATENSRSLVIADSRHFHPEPRRTETNDKNTMHSILFKRNHNIWYNSLVQLEFG